VFAGIETVPSSFNVNSSGTLSPVRITFPGYSPIITVTLFSVSLLVNGSVIPPVNPFTSSVVSITASITGAETAILAVAESQFVGLLTSHI
jgi:hypothetical protein